MTTPDTVTTLERRWNKLELCLIGTKMDITTQDRIILEKLTVPHLASVFLRVM